MCGINAIYAWHPDAPPADRDELIRTREAMRGRGPDAAGSWLSPDRRVALGHRRLAILDPDERANQPMLANGAGVVFNGAAVVFNGEIYNFRELRAELRAEPEAASFVTTSDTEVLLRMYLRFGAAMLPRLRGMFALAVWDGRRLFLARDPYGIKPLYYADAAGTFRLASQVKALVAGGGVSSTRDPAGIAGFFLRGSVPEPFTTYEAIRALPAGHWMEVTAAGPSKPQPYFSLAEAWREASEEDGEAADEATDVAEALRESVRLHLVSDVPVGAFLSAGRDSGSIVALAAESGAPLSTLTLRFDEYAGTEQDEAPLAAIVARRYGTQHTTVTVTRPEFERELPRVLAAMDQPSIDALNAWFVSRAAAQLGWKVALSGTGGDELFGGYGTFRSIPRFVRAFSIFRHLPRLARLYATAHRHLTPRGARFSPKSALAPTYCHSYEGAYLVKRGLFLPEELPALLGEEMAEEGLRKLAMLEQFRAALTPDPGSPFARVATLEAAFYLRNQLLRDLDWCSMAHPLEVRLPLVDPFLLRRVGHAALRGGKDLLTRAPRHQLPDAVLKRRKTGFTIPAHEWLDIPAGAGRAHPFGRRNWALFLYETAVLSKPVSDRRLRKYS